MANVGERCIESNQVQRLIVFIYWTGEYGCAHKHVHSNRDSLFVEQETVQYMWMASLN